MVQKFKPTSVSNEVNRFLLLSLLCSFAFASELCSDAESKLDSATRSGGILPYRWKYTIST